MKLSFEENKALGRLLKAHRKQSNLTQPELEEKSGVPIRTIRRAEGGDGIRGGNLDCLAKVFDTDARALLARACSEKNASPELRLALKQITKAEDLMLFLGKVGTLQVGPPGEHDFNAQLGHRLIELQGEIETAHDKPATTKKLRRDAAHILRSSEQLGFSVFAVHYCEEYKRTNKVVRKPTTLIIGATRHDERIEKTPKGLVLDYIMDSRRQPLANLKNGCSTLFDWMKDQSISKSDGPERVATVLRVPHEQKRPQTKRRKDC